MHRARARPSEYSVAELAACDGSLAASWDKYLQPLLHLPGILVSSKGSTNAASKH